MENETFLNSQTGRLMKIFLAPISCVVAFALLFSGCASYDAQPLGSLSQDVLKSSQQDSNKNVFVSAKAFNRNDCKRFLDRDVLAKGYQPVQLCIQNNSDKSYSFSLSRINLSCVAPEVVSKKVHTSTVARAAGYGSAALVFLPMVIPAVIDGIKSEKANEALDDDFSSKAARDQTIQPHSRFNKLLFVPVYDYQSQFKIELVDQKDGQVEEFNVTIANE
jgi:hypothetical protein